MTSWDERLEGSVGVNALRAARQLAHQLDAPDALRESLERTRYVLDLMTGFVEVADGQLVSSDMLAALESRATPLLTALRALEAPDIDPSVGYPDVNAYVDGVLDVMRAWPALSVAQAGDAVQHALHLVESSAEAVSERFATKVSEQEERMAGLVGRLTEIEALREQAAQRLQAFEAQANTDAEGFRVGLASKTDELSATIDSQKARLDEAIAAFQGQFSAAEEERRRLAEEARAAERTTAENHGTSLLETSAAVLAKLEAHREQAAKVADAIGTIGLAEGYGNDAAIQKTTADNLRWGALASLAAAAGVALWAAAARTEAGDFQLDVFLARSLVSLALASLGAYCIIQSERHRERERQDSKIALELASITPYLALMPEEVQIEIKKKLAEKWFGQPLAPINETGGAHAVSIPMAEIVKAFIKQGSG